MSQSLIKNIAYIRTATNDVEKSARFATEVLGLEKSRDLNGEICFRSDARLRTLSFFSAAPPESVVGVSIIDDAAMDKAKKNLVQHGFDVAELSKEESFQGLGRRIVQTRDGSGNRVDLVLGPFHAGQRFFPSRDSGVTELQGLALRSIDMERDTEFWTQALGARITDWVGDATYLATDDLHHRIVLHPSKKTGVLYTAFAVEDLDNVMQSSYYAEEHQVRVLQGPGRQPASDQIFLHLQGPDDSIYSFVCETRQVDPSTHRPRQFEASPDGLCNWGTVCEDVPELQPAGLASRQGDGGLPEWFIQHQRGK